MRAITIYEAIDGQRFDTQEQCASHESLLGEIRNAMEPLGRPVILDSDQYIHHDREAYLEAKRRTLKIVMARLDHKFFTENNPDDIHPHSMAVRLIDDCCNEAIKRAWGRLGRINDATGKEYQQAYFAMNECPGSECIEDRRKERLP